MTARKRKAKSKKAPESEVIAGTPPVPHVVEAKPEPTLWERFKRVFGWS